MDSLTFNKSGEELNRVVTVGVLLDYTDTFLLPKIEEIVTDIVTDTVKGEIAKSEYRLKSYIDDKLSSYTSDIFKRLDEKYRFPRLKPWYYIIAPRFAR